MNKRQYTFLGLMTILLYLSFKILEFEYSKYTISQYTSKQMVVIKDIKSYLDTANDTIEYIQTKAFKNKILKEDWKKMKWEDVIVLTTEKLYNKFSWKIIVPQLEKKEDIKEENIVKSMTNFQKWVYLLLKRDLR
jgi:hypothetical protein